MVVGGNTVTDAASVGIDVRNTRWLQVNGNDVTESVSGIGVRVGATSTAAERYTIDANTGQGVELSATHAASVVTATGNEVEWLRLAGSGFRFLVESNTVGRSGGSGDVTVTAAAGIDTLTVRENFARTMSVSAGMAANRRGTVAENEIDGAGLAKTAGLVVTGDHFDVLANTVGGASAGGLVLTGDEGLVSGNAVVGNAGTGVTVTGDNNRIVGNRVEGNTGVGLRLNGGNNKVGSASSSDANTIRGNGAVLGRRGHGIWVTGSGNSIRANEVAQNAGRGIAPGRPEQAAHQRQRVVRGERRVRRGRRRHRGERPAEPPRLLAHRLRRAACSGC